VKELERGKKCDSPHDLTAGSVQNPGHRARLLLANLGYARLRRSMLNQHIRDRSEQAVDD
jgi:hypothetical protein